MPGPARFVQYVAWRGHTARLGDDGGRSGHRIRARSGRATFVRPQSGRGRAPVGGGVGAGGGRSEPVGNRRRYGTGPGSVDRVHRRGPHRRAPRSCQAAAGRPDPHRSGTRRSIAGPSAGGGGGHRCPLCRGGCPFRVAPDRGPLLRVLRHVGRRIGHRPVPRSGPAAPHLLGPVHRGPTAGGHVGGRPPLAQPGWFGHRRRRGLRRLLSRVVVRPPGHGLRRRTPGRRHRASPSGI